MLYLQREIAYFLLKRKVDEHYDYAPNDVTGVLQRKVSRHLLILLVNKL